ncbi:MAG: twin-arginine translocase subunit TatC [Gammaproteobacteria bacterium]|nr:twin-arginine translocase subunit TatC [Gammaproteobacteria bacterium]
MEETPLLSHLIELRRRILYSLTALLSVFGGLIFFSQELYHALAKPLLRYLPPNASMIATEVSAPFLIPLKLTGVVSLFVVMPFVIYQLWKFVAPGLYVKEKRLAVPLLCASVVLFYLGVLFAYGVVLPICFKFFVGVLPTGVTMMTDMSRYLDFVLVFFFVFGIAFETPIVTLLCVLLEVVTVGQLSNSRPYMIVGAFVVGMILTPPDVISQIVMALSLWGLFEVGLYTAKIYRKLCI